MNKLNRIFQDYIKNNTFSGAVCMVWENGTTIIEESYGYRNCSIENNSEKSFLNFNKMNLHTIFDLASVSKMFITTIVLRLISTGQLHLEEKLGDCLPKLNESLRLKISDITIKQLLSHSSGIRAWYPFYIHKNKNFYTILDNIIMPLSLQKEVIYSDINFMLLGEVIKEKSMMSLHECVNEMLVQPLQLDTLTYGPIDNDNVAATEYGNKIEQVMCSEMNVAFNGWRREDLPMQGEANDGNCHYFFNGVAGHAGLFASALDVLKLGKLYVKGGEWEGKSYLNRDLVEMSFMEFKQSRGLGWEISNKFPNGCGHTGFTGTTLWIIPKKKIVVVTLTNRLNVKNPVPLDNFRLELHQNIIRYINSKGD